MGNRYLKRLSTTCIVAKEARHTQEVPESLNSFEDVKGVESSSKWMKVVVVSLIDSTGILVKAGKLEIKIVDFGNILGTLNVSASSIVILFRMSLAEKEDRKNVIGLVTNAKDTCGRSKGGFLEKKSQQFPNEAEGFQEKCKGRDVPVDSNLMERKVQNACALPEELFVPLSVYYLKTDITPATETSSGRDMEFFTLWKR
ncbi:hypothetical protein SADUNF_Sadunf02G0034000 [Salix dunnii]|uniref:Uncharacterized protein n=1 Tax=Salix dunnii TaxID=1413687 RepID=A0A835TG10_9ROSI|nr:hypothetical protein SADUNF_Sadunf02G0034000 [Salix dunnii]